MEDQRLKVEVPRKGPGTKVISGVRDSRTSEDKSNSRSRGTPGNRFRKTVDVTWDS